MNAFSTVVVTWVEGDRVVTYTVKCSFQAHGKDGSFAVRLKLVNDLFELQQCLALIAVVRIRTWRRKGNRFLPGVVLAC